MKKTDRLTCNEDLLGRIRGNLRRFEVRSLAGEGLTRAAVALTVVDVDQERGLYGIPMEVLITLQI